MVFNTKHYLDIFSFNFVISLYREFHKNLEYLSVIVMKFIYEIHKIYIIYCAIMCMKYLCYVLLL